MIGGDKKSDASVSSVLSTLQNMVAALATIYQNYLNVQGAISIEAITAPVVVKSQGGRVCVVSVIVAGSAPGFIYDAVKLGDTTKPLYVIPNTVGVEPYLVNLPTNFGIVVVPGTGQTVTVSYS